MQRLYVGGLHPLTQNNLIRPDFNQQIVGPRPGRSATKPRKGNRGGMNLFRPGKHRHLNELFGVVWMAAALLLLLCLLSYSPQDHSLNTAGLARLPDSQAEQTANWVGVAGSYTADLFLQAFGFVAFILPPFLALLGWHLLRSRAMPSPRQKFLGVVLLVSSLTAMLGLFEELPKTYGVFPAGGLTGTLLASAMVSVLNFTGALVVTFACVVVGMLLATPFTISDSTGWAQKNLGAIRNLRPKKFSLPSFRLPSMRIKLGQPHDEFEDENDSPPPRIMPKTAADGTPLPAPLRDAITGEEEPAPAAEPGSAASKVLSMLTLRKTSGKTKAESPPEPGAAPTRPERPTRIAGSRYRLPSVSLLHNPQHAAPPNESELRARAEAVVEKLDEFAVTGEVVQINPGPVVTTFEFRPEAGVKLSRITNLAEDLCLALRAESILIERIPGKSTVGIEVPNDERDTITLREIAESQEFAAARSKLSVPMGKDLRGNVKVADLTTMPHLLVAGATGTGKSVAINSFIVSILYKATPEEVKLILVDPKRLELGLYEGIPHLYTPIVTEPKVAANVLRNAVREMERRLKLLARHGVRSLAQFNKLFDSEATLPGLNEDGEEMHPLPYLVIVIDELADLMMVDTLNVEGSITRLAQMSRAVGIHLVLATQRPSVDVITGLIKANFPARVSFRVATRVDSRTILDGNGAESLLGMGDMLYLPAGSSRLRRIHGPLVTEKEIEDVCNFWRAQGDPTLHEEFLKAPKETGRAGVGGTDSSDPSAEDDLYDEAVQIVCDLRKASTSTLQRRLRIGYGRAARLIDTMEREGIVGPPDGSKPREVLRRIDPVGV